MQARVKEHAGAGHVSACQLAMPMLMHGILLARGSGAEPHCVAAWCSRIREPLELSTCAISSATMAKHNSQSYRSACSCSLSLKLHLVTYQPGWQRHSTGNRQALSHIPDVLGCMWQVDCRGGCQLSALADQNFQ